MKKIAVGDSLPVFSLKNQNDAIVDTPSMIGTNILLSFHPLAWTDICAKQMLALEANFEKFQALNTVPLGLSVDAAPCKKAWAKSLGIEKLSLLADFWPHGGFAAALGLFIDKLGFSERANVVIDAKKQAVFVKVYPLKELPDIDEVIAFLTNVCPSP